jgi:hypothetical protein
VRGVTISAQAVRAPHRPLPHGSDTVQRNYGNGSPRHGPYSKSGTVHGRYGSHGSLVQLVAYLGHLTFLCTFVLMLRLNARTIKMPLPSTVWAFCGDRCQLKVLSLEPKLAECHV